jgi:sulfate transport system substrate-binding protein
MKAQKMKLEKTTAEDRGDWRHLACWVLVGFLLLAGAYYLGPMFFNNLSSPQRLVVYAFSTQEEVFSQGIIPAFERLWEMQSGADLIIEGVYAPSGTLAGQINLGAPADVAVFSNANHVNWLKIGKVVGRNTEPIMIGATPIVIVTRPGNPKGIVEWSDLALPGLSLIHEDPRSSGAGEWALLAEFGSVYLENSDPVSAKAQLHSIWQNVGLLSPSARSALSLFELGRGDAAVTYEQDALLALARGVPLEIVVPPRTIIARPVAVMVDENVKGSEVRMVQAFLNFLTDETGQHIFDQYYLRPLSPERLRYTPIPHPFTEEDLGGWSWANSELVEGVWQAEIEPFLELEKLPVELNHGKMP